MLTAKDLKEMLKGVPDNAPIIIHTSSRGRGHDGHTAKYITDDKNAPYDGNMCIEDAIATSGGAVVISDWEF